MDSEHVEEVDENVFKQFIVFLKSSSIDKVEEMINTYGNAIVNKLQSQLRQPPLYFAVNLPDDDICYQVMEKLISAGANAQFKDQNEQTVIFYACRDGKIKCVNLLIQNGVSLYEPDAYGQIPLFYIASENQIQLLQKYPDKQYYNHVDKLAQQTPLYYAAKKGHLEMCKELIQRGCSVIHHDVHHKTAVQYSRRARYHEVTEYLSAQVKKVRQAIRNEQHQAKQLEKQNESSHPQKKKKIKQKQPIAQLQQSPKVQRNTYKLVYMDEKGQIHNVTEEEAKKMFVGKPIQEYIKDPNLIPREYLGKNDQSKWEKQATKILNHCWRVKGAFWFHEPVDPVKFGILDYHDIITHPMDFGTIKKKLNFNAYKHPQDFVSDMRLIWENCYKYNGEQHDISICAKDVEKAFQEQYEQNLKNFNADQIVDQ